METAYSTIRGGLDPAGRRAWRGGSEPAIASVLGESRAHRSGLYLGLELGDQLGVALRFAMHGVLQSLNQLLEVRHPRLERLDPIWTRGSAIGCGPISGRRGTTDLADPCDQAFAVANRHCRFARFG